MSKIHEIGRVYCIRSYLTDKVYIGSTFQPLHKRLYEHKIDYKKWQNDKYHYVTSFELIKYDDCYIELIEEYENLNKKQLEKYEGEHIRKNNCVNKYIAGRTIKQYREDNVDKLKERGKKYREDNTDKLKQYEKQYRENNVDKIKLKKNQKHICICGGKYTQSNKLQHEKTKKHINFINN